MSNTHPLRPMPTTGMPDRVDPRDQPSPINLKAGATFGKMQVTNGRDGGAAYPGRPVGTCRPDLAPVSQHTGIKK